MSRSSTRVRVAAQLAAGALVAAALLLAWLDRAEPADPAVRAVRQQRALVLAIFALATVATPWAFASIAAGTRHASWGAYAAAIPAPLVLGALALWLRPAGAPPAILVGRAVALLLAYGVLACAGTDVCRLAAPSVGPLVPMCAGALACLSPFVAGPWVEHAPDQARREVRIAWVVAANPLLAATAALPDYDPLRAEHVYERTPIGAYFVYRLPDPWEVAAAYLGLAIAMAGAATAARRWVVRDPLAASAHHA